MPTYRGAIISWWFSVDNACEYVCSACSEQSSSPGGEVAERVGFFDPGDASFEAELEGEEGGAGGELVSAGCFD